MNSIPRKRFWLLRRLAKALTVTAWVVFALVLLVTPVGVARAYRDFLDVLVLDQQDADVAGAVQQLGIKTHVTDTIMRDLEIKERLARETLSAISE